MPYTQDDKLISVKTALGNDVLLLTGFTGTERLSALFSFDLSMVAESDSISAEALLGKRMTLAIGLADGSNRYINGITARFTQGRGGGEAGGDARFTYYTATLVPWLWELSQTEHSRIFQNLSVAEIVENVFTSQGFKDYRSELQGNYEKREFCVQYRESDLNFISRLLEEEGIFYYFDHEQEKHTMVLADSPSAHKPCPGQKVASCQLSAEGVRADDAIASLELIEQVGPTKCTLNDFNFKVPNTSLQVELETRRRTAGDRELYLHPAGFTARAAGERLAKVRMEEQEAGFLRIMGASDCRAFATGYRFTLRDHYCTDLNNKEYVLVAVHHEAAEGYGGNSGQSYRNTFECLPHVVPYRPPRIASRPVVIGAQTAIVVGPKGEEIHTDEHGRVKVQFHWDREGKRDDQSSCWIRVSQPWAGNGWGVMFVPRIGQEVIVNFLEGDPDRPIVTGQLYNGVNRPPYALPAEMTKTVMKSDSSPGGNGTNEIRFEDKKGSEQLLIHAEKDQENRVKGDARAYIGNDSHLVVGRDHYMKVCGDQHCTVIGDRSEKVDGALSQSVAQDLLQKVGVKQLLDAGQEIHLSAGTMVVIEAGARISLKVGGSFIDIGPAGISINGALVRINSGGSAAIGSGIVPDLVKLPREAATTDPGKPVKKSEIQTRKPQVKSVVPQAESMKTAANSGAAVVDT